MLLGITVAHFRSSTSATQSVAFISSYCLASHSPMPCTSWIPARPTGKRYTDNYIYLGHVINSRLADDADIMRHTRSFYVMANSIVRKFSSSFCAQSFCCLKPSVHWPYGCSLWCSMFQYSLNKLRVASYNDAFRFLLNEPRWCSASRLFVLHNVPSFSAIIR